LYTIYHNSSYIEVQKKQEMRQEIVWLYDWSMSCLIFSTILWRKAILCKERRLAQSISCSLIRWWRYDLLKFLHVWHPQFLSSGEKSSLYCICFNFMTHDVLKALPCLPSLVGITQSNISIPCSMASRISSGVPTPMRYLGLSIGRWGWSWLRI